MFDIDGKTYNCTFRNCPHKSRDVPCGEAVKVSTNKYMHRDCAKNSSNISKIADLYYQKVSNTVVMKQLVGVIEGIIFKKQVDSDYLLFALKRAISEGIPIKSPYGLYYLIDDQKIKDKWKKIKADEVVALMRKDEIASKIDPEANSFFYGGEKGDGFEKVLKGGANGVK